MFDKLFSKLRQAQVPAEPLAEPEKPKKPSNPRPKVKKMSEKEQATAQGQPWVQVLGIELDENNPGSGAFELDWNDTFVAKLVRSGYQGRTDQDIVDNWFQDICRHVVLETYQQEQADPDRRDRSVQRRDLGNGRSEFS